MTNEQPEPSGATSESSDSRPTDALIRPLPGYSGRPSGTPFQNSVMDAVTGSEFTDTVESGIPVRRRGAPLHIPYDQAMAMLWPPQES